jgi:hypothetical protein
MSAEPDLASVPAPDDRGPLVGARFNHGPPRSKVEWAGARGKGEKRNGPSSGFLLVLCFLFLFCFPNSKVQMNLNC